MARTPALTTAIPNGRVCFYQDSKARKELEGTVEREIQNSSLTNMTVENPKEKKKNYR